MSAPAAHGPRSVERRFRWTVAMVVTAALVAGACAGGDTATDESAGVVAYKAIDSNGSYLQPGASNLLGRRDLTVAVNLQTQQGLRIGPLTSGSVDAPSAMIDRIAADASRLDPAVVLVQIGTVDTWRPEGYEDYGLVIDDLLGRPSMQDRRVAWFEVSENSIVPPFTVEGRVAIVTALREAAARHDDLWVVPIDAVWEAAFDGGCPIFDLEALTWSIEPLTSCYEDLGLDPHLDRVNGQLAQGLIEDAVIRAGIDGTGWADDEALVTSLRQTIGLRGDG